MIRIPVKKAKKPMIYNVILINQKKVLDLHISIAVEPKLRDLPNHRSAETLALASCLFKKIHIIPIPKAIMAFEELIILSGVNIMI